MALSNPAWAQQASSALAVATRERVELQRAIVEAEDSIVRCAFEFGQLMPIFHVLPSRPCSSHCAYAIQLFVTVF